jgi:hypothetical protein
MAKSAHFHIRNNTSTYIENGSLFKELKLNLQKNINTLFTIYSNKIAYDFN